MSAANEPAGAAVPRQSGRPARPSGRGAVLVVTTDTLPGYEVRQVLGEVLGVLARPRNPYTEGVKALSGKRVNPELSGASLTRWRQDAIARMAQQARERGANAVIGLRFDHRDITGAWGEICAYGTAVYVEQLAPQEEQTSNASWPS